MTFHLTGDKFQYMFAPDNQLEQKRTSARQRLYRFERHFEILRRKNGLFIDWPAWLHASVSYSKRWWRSAPPEDSSFFSVPYVPTTSCASEGFLKQSSSSFAMSTAATSFPSFYAPFSLSQASHFLSGLSAGQPFPCNNVPFFSISSSPSAHFFSTPHTLRFSFGYTQIALMMKMEGPVGSGKNTLSLHHVLTLHIPSPSSSFSLKFKLQVCPFSCIRQPKTGRGW